MEQIKAAVARQKRSVEESALHAHVVSRCLNFNGSPLSKYSGERVSFSGAQKFEVYTLYVVNIFTGHFRLSFDVIRFYKQVVHQEITIAAVFSIKT